MQGIHVFVSALSIISIGMTSSVLRGGSELGLLGAADGGRYNILANRAVSAQYMTLAGKNYAKHLENFYMLDTDALLDGAVFLQNRRKQM